MSPLMFIWRKSLTMRFGNFYILLALCYGCEYHIIKYSAMSKGLKQSAQWLLRPASLMSVLWPATLWSKHLGLQRTR